MKLLSHFRNKGILRALQKFSLTIQNQIINEVMADLWCVVRADPQWGFSRLLQIPVTDLKPFTLYTLSLIKEVLRRENQGLKVYPVDDSSVFSLTGTYFWFVLSMLSGLIYKKNAWGRYTLLLSLLLCRVTTSRFKILRWWAGGKCSVWPLPPARVQKKINKNWG